MTQSRATSHDSDAAHRVSLSGFTQTTASIESKAIEQTISKQAGHGPYLWVAIWYTDKNDGPYATVFSFWEDAREFADRLAENGHTVETIDLGVDRTRRAKAGTPRS